MQTRVLAMLLVLVSPSLLAAPERVTDILKDLQAHGYSSPAAAAQRLQAAPDARDTQAPTEQRRRYYAALIALSLPDKNLGLLQQALDGLHEMARQDHCQPCQAQWLIGKAQKSTLARQLKQARADLEQAVPLVGADDPAMQLELARARVGLERRQGTLNVAFRQTLVAMDLAEHLGDKATHIELSIVLAVLEAELGYLDQSQKTIDDAAARAQAAGFKAALALARLNQGYVNARLDQRAKQAQALRQALAIAQQESGLAYIEVYARANLSDYYLNRREYAATLAQARKAAELAHAIDNITGEAIALANIGIATARLGHAEAGAASLRKALQLARQTGDLRNQAGINRELVKVLQAAGHYKEALEAQQAIDSVNARITQQARDSAVLELQAKYDDERKNRQIEQLSTQARLKQAEADARRWQQRMWTVLAGVAVLVALLLVLRLALARRANRQLKHDVASLTEQSALDDLTGAFNRRHFAALMQPFGHGAAIRVGLAMVDIDHFKRINDSLGHEAGDLVLKEVALRLQSLARGNDQLVRWGGEEFVLVLPEASPHNLPLMAQRLLDALAKRPIQVGQNQLHVSASIGCVVHPLGPGASWEQTMRLADLTLYRAKRRGRNRAACVTMLAKPLPRDFAEDDIEAAVHAGTLVLDEVIGPVVPAAAPAEVA